MPQLIIKIVDRGTNHTNQKTGEAKPSLTGHMWFELVDDGGNVSSYGFAPVDIRRSFVKLDEFFLEQMIFQVMLCQFFLFLISY